MRIGVASVGAVPEGRPGHDDQRQSGECMGEYAVDGGRRARGRHGDESAAVRQFGYDSGTHGGHFSIGIEKRAVEVGDEEMPASSLVEAFG